MALAAYNKFKLYLSALHAYLENPLFLIKMFKIRNNREKIWKFYVDENLKLVKEKCNKKTGISFEDIFENNILTYYYFSHLYSLCRLIKPSIIIETGVGAGISSTYILQAIEDNGFGKLYSIDFPKAIYSIENNRVVNAGFWLPDNQSSGWIIPTNLKENWELILGKSIEKLLPLLKQVGSIDLFFHDSEHTYQNMMFEYNAAWPYLNKQGILASHDVNWNNAFTDFAYEVNAKPNILKNDFGYIIRN